ncbi:hypothetical protein B0H67DRAFT_547994 [Lasiosphaeris hirsuta]|uniref:Uncharacterized protein n=1 Tax=Lasiosphaeris hirsuta TaxID=260670 RepID=A0AA40B9F3_9PEZI|nr:hypothetical protein B0H67DRAFT_547994 [Lasiosphaeris hirsuta]
MDEQLGSADIQSIFRPVPKQYLMENYFCPRLDSARRHRGHRRTGRDSLGSNSSVPGMVEDHGSDVSLEDDYQYHATGTELWDPFRQARARSEASRRLPYPALIASPAGVQLNALSHTPAMERKIQQTTGGARNSEEDEPTRSVSPLPASAPRCQRPRTPRAPSRASYSIFPPVDPERRPPALAPPLRMRDSSLIPLQHASQSLINLQRSNVGTKINHTAHISSSSAVSLTTNPHKTVPHSAKSSFSTTTTVTNNGASTPLSPIRPYPTYAGRETPSDPKPLPDPPAQWRTTRRRPSLTSLRKLSLSKISTQSSPALASLAQAQAEAALAELPPPPIPESRYQNINHFHQSSWSSLSQPPYPQPTRPLPPLPGFVPGHHPQISVFEEDDDTDGSFSDRFKRRFRRGPPAASSGAAQRAGKTEGSHLRSVSDGRSIAGSNPPASSSPRGHRGRAKSDEIVGPTRAGGVREAVLKEEEGEGVGGAEKEGGGPKTKQKSRSTRPWISRQSSEMFGRFMGRWNAATSASASSS